MHPWTSFQGCFHGKKVKKVDIQAWGKYPIFPNEIEIIANRTKNYRLKKHHQMSLLRGRRYNRAKRQGERTDLTLDQNDTKLHTADRLAKEHGVSPEKCNPYQLSAPVLTASTNIILMIPSL